MGSWVAAESGPQVVVVGTSVWITAGVAFAGAILAAWFQRARWLGTARRDAYVHVLRAHQAYVRAIEAYAERLATVGSFPPRIMDRETELLEILVDYWEPVEDTAKAVREAALEARLAGSRRSHYLLTALEPFTTPHPAGYQQPPATGEEIRQSMLEDAQLLRSIAQRAGVDQDAFVSAARAELGVEAGWRARTWLAATWLYRVARGVYRRLPRPLQKVLPRSLVERVLVSAIRVGTLRNR